MLFNRLQLNRHPRLLISAGALAIAVFVACGGSDIEPTAVADVVAPESSPSISCVLSGSSSDFPVSAVPGINVLPTELDGVNTGECIFSERITEVRVPLFYVGEPFAGFKAISEAISVETSSVIGFPIAAGPARVEVSSLLPLGRYVRKMEAMTESGGMIEIQTELNEVATEVFLVDAPNATIMWRTDRWQIGNKQSPNQHG